MRTRTALAVAAVALAMTAAACGSSSSSSSTPAKTSTGGGQASKPVDPNAPETSPAGDIPDNQAFVAYSPPGGGFSVKVPEGWSRTSAAGAVTFTDKLNAIRMQSATASAPLTVARARSVELPALAKTVKGFRPGTVSSVSRAAGSAVRMTYLANGAPNAVTGKVRRDAVERYVFFHAGRRVVLTLSGPKGADNVDPWKLVTNSLRWTR
ncbi:MAG: hypothetical protein QOG35_1145 [Solirubrobacteraceae bacterium]|nr:hypothetical protein [Solirubrobacteraceae bacterium]